MGRKLLLGFLLISAVGCSVCAAWKELITGSNEPTPVAGVRGLDKSSGEIDTTARDYPAIDRLEKIKVSAQDLQAFAQEGGLR